MRSLKTSAALALAFGLGVALTGVAAAQQQELQDMPAVCDQDGNGFISTSEAADCDEREATTLFGDDESMTEEQFSEAYGDQGDVEGVFSEADADGDGEVSQQEWMDWREQGFAAATEDTENQMPATDYDDWNPGFPEGGGDQGIDEGSHDPSTYGEEQQD
jgi:hypothetical protein